MCTRTPIGSLLLGVGLVCCAVSPSFFLNILYLPASHERKVGMKGKASAKKYGERQIYGGLREEIGMKTYVHGPMDYAKMLKKRFRVGDLDLPEGRKEGHQQSGGGKRCTDITLT